MRTALYPFHEKLGAKIVNFSGWEMPLHYQGIVSEHLAVRLHVGIFDVSHMGRIAIEGPDAGTLLNFLSTNEVADKKAGTATYTLWCTSSGTCLDDLIVYKEDAFRYFVVVNAGNRQKDLMHLQKQAQEKRVNIIPHYDNEGILAVQGPEARGVLSEIFPESANLSPMHFATYPFLSQNIILSRTGYTGSDGFEIYGSNDSIVTLWGALLEKGKKYGMVPVGLGARDTLRLEMGYALYGHELNEQILAHETVSSWTIQRNKKDLLGKDALDSSNVCRHAYGVVLKENSGIAREGFEVFQNDQPIGHVTSGTFSPSLNRSIALVLVEKKLCDGDSVEIKIRQNLCPAQVTRLPFYHRGEKK